MRKKILFVAYLYPPAGGKALPGVQRTVKFVRNLKENQTYVLTLKPQLYPDFFSDDNSLSLPIRDEAIAMAGTFDVFNVLLKIKEFITKKSNSSENEANSDTQNIENLDESDDVHLANKEESRLKKLYTGFKDFISDIMTYPDYAHGWVLPAILEGRKVIKRENIDVIFATGMPWSSLLVGFGLKILTGAKLIVDFRDPWATNPFATEKRFIVKVLDRFCEKQIVKRADCISLNTPELTKEFQTRYKFLPENKFQTLMNGYDPVDFKNLQANNLSVDPEKLVISHIGYLYGLRNPQPVLQALKEITGENAQLLSNIIFKQIGYTDLENDICSEIASMKLSKNYLDLGPLPYNEALQHMASSDILLIIQQETTTQIPSKIYEYIYLNKPIVTVGSKTGALATLIQDYEFGDIFLDSEVKELAEFFVQQANKKAETGEIVANYTSRELFDIKIISNRLSEIVESL